MAAGCTAEHIRQFPQVLKLVQPAKNSMGNERELPIPTILLEEGYDPERQSIVYKRLELEDLMKRWKVDSVCFSSFCCLFSMCK
uniref:Uncharacterized protein n=1 Tax=Nelumbo nucifera TaxID=4432 RepID=A0A822XRB7_NELNU|nr:TPA_asm: hypothetical protein HUJ06_022768 [Nelumbo nucifera]